MTLREFLLTCDPTVRTRVLLIAQLLEAIRFLNEQKIAHRDLKSNNILLDFDTDESKKIDSNIQNLIQNFFNLKNIARIFFQYSKH